MMKIISNAHDGGKEMTIFDMRRGQVCFLLEDRKYVMRIHSTWLLIEDGDRLELITGILNSANSVYKCRELVAGESVTVEFS